MRPHRNTNLQQWFMPHKKITPNTTRKPSHYLTLHPAHGYHRQKQRYKFGCLLLLVCALSTSLQAHSQSQSPSATESQTNASLARVTQQIEQIATALNEGQMQLKKERTELQNTEEAIIVLSNQLRTITQEINQSRRKANALKPQIEQLQLTMDAIRPRLVKLIIDQYKQDTDDAVKQLLNQQNPYAVGRLTHYRDYFSAAMAQKIKAYQIDAAQLVEQQTLYAETLALLKQTQATKQAQQRRLTQTKAARAEVVTKLDASLNTQASQLRKLEEDRARLTQLLTSLKEQAKLLSRQQTRGIQPLAPGGFRQQRGRLAPPVTAPVKTGFNDRIATSGVASNGLWFEAKNNTLVTSVYKGVVIFSGYLKGYGQLIIIDHGDEYLSLYGHNQTLNKRVGERVATNEPIGRVGNSGGLKEPSLYFEIRRNARPINPAEWLSQ